MSKLGVLVLSTSNLINKIFKYLYKKKNIIVLKKIVEKNSILYRVDSSFFASMAVFKNSNFRKKT